MSKQPDIRAALDDLRGALGHPPATLAETLKGIIDNAPDGVDDLPDGAYWGMITEVFNNATGRSFESWKVQAMIVDNPDFFGREAL